jgi:acetolactate synthase-1/2/3 large subunit
MPNTQTVAEAVADELALAGIDRVFGLPGGEVLALMDALRRRGISFELCRHEANAGFMAAVYGKLKGVPGAVLTTLGPGAANLLLPITNCWLDREPLVAISADIPTSWPNWHTHQRLPLHDIFGPVVKAGSAITSLNARAAVRRAVTLAQEEPQGPTYITLSAEDAISTTPQRAVTGDAGDDVSMVEAIGPAADELTRRIAAAERPLVVLGLGVRAMNATLLRAWLDAWNLPFAVTPKVKGLVDETHPLFVGVVGGMSLDAVMVDALRHADLLIGFGFDPTEVDKRWHTELPILWVLESPQATGVMPTKEVIACPHDGLLERLGTTPPPRSWADAFASQRASRLATLRGEGRPEPAAGTVEPTALVRAVAAVSPPETILTTDVGSHKYLFGQFWPNREPMTFFQSNGLSGMGYGLPAAMGAKLARPNVPVIAVLGDGGFSMNSQELETAERIGAPVIVVVLADNSYSLIRHSQVGRGLPNYGVDFGPIDSVALARACGVDGVRATTTEEISSVVREAMTANRSLVVEVPVDPEAWRGLV